MNRDSDKGKILLQKTLILAALNFFLILILIGRLYYLQVYQGEKYKVLSDENRISTRILVPPRGIVYDRNGVILATNEQNFQALIIAEQVRNVEQTLERFRQLMPLEASEEERIIKDIRRNRKFVPIKIKDNLTWEEVSAILLNAPYLPGIVIDQGLNRYYPEGLYTAPFLGYVGAVSDKDEKDDPLLLVPDFKIGKAGLEKAFEKQLRGQGGNIKLEVNAYGRVMKEIERNKGTAGENLTLTIDLRLQKTAMDAFGDQSGAAVVLDVHSGEILAFVSAPSFDPNLFTKGISYKDWNALLNHERHPLTNKAVAGQYSPGSTFKIVVALAALEAGLIDEHTRFNCTGMMPLGNHQFHCWRHTGHGPQTVVEALKNSCDIFFYEVALRLGIDRIAETARRLGMGAPTGITLENEQSGLIPDKEWKKRRFGTSWQQGESVIAGIGQGYVLATPLQLATMLARIVNGGYTVHPTFVAPTLHEKGKIKKLHFSPRNIELVKEGMFQVVNGDGGTAGRARFNINGVQMGGKTGTTQVRRISLQERKRGIIKDENLPWNLRNHALFIGYAPQDNPQYAVAVVVEHGSSGSGIAAPIASKILQQAVRLHIK
jgi:penicillin-binding protein 2